MTFRRNALPSSSGSENKPRKQTARRICVIFLLHLFLDPEDGGSMFLGNVGEHLQNYMASYSRKELSPFQ
jgi:hypothetical protein